MTGPLRRIALFFLIALVVGGFVGRFVFLGSSDDTAATDLVPSARPANLAAAQAAAAASPDDPALLVNVGYLALDEARRTADPAFFAQADQALTRALEMVPDDLRTIVPAGLLALARHDFNGALALAERARTVAPLAVDPLGIQIDALVELGRYEEAAVLADEMVSRRPNVGSLSRLSYVLELTGNSDGALETMQQAVAAGGARDASGAYVLALLGDVHLLAGRLDAAQASYERALAVQKDQPQAEFGLARVLSDRGDFEGAAKILEKFTQRIPLPDAVTLYADVLAAKGDAVGAGEQRSLVRAIEALNRTQGGVSVDLELAKFEASHARLADGKPDEAVRLAEAGRAARPTIYGDDVLGWALRQAGRPAEALPYAQAATRLGTADATLWWHLAAIEADLGMTAEARTHLERSRSISPYLPLNERAEADALAKTLGL